MYMYVKRGRERATGIENEKSKERERDKERRECNRYNTYSPVLWSLV